MVNILSYIKGKLAELGIPYEYGEWTAPVTYPYFVGNFEETDHRFEDNCTTGVFTLDGWQRGQKHELLLLTDRVKRAFEDLAEYVKDDWEWDPFDFRYGMIDDDGRTFFIRYGGSGLVPSGEAGLSHVTITLYTYEWRGED